MARSDLYGPLYWSERARGSYRINENLGFVSDGKPWATALWALLSYRRGIDAANRPALQQLVGEICYHDGRCFLEGIPIENFSRVGLRRCRQALGLDPTAYQRKPKGIV